MRELVTPTKLCPECPLGFTNGEPYYERLYKTGNGWVRCLKCDYKYREEEKTNDEEK